MSFFDNGCQALTAWSRFGIIDDINQPNAPAYITDLDPLSWDVIVNNLNNKNLIFYAIDGCILFYQDQSHTQLESTCDAALVDDVTVHFIEIKKRASKGWAGTAYKQLVNTISLYRANDQNAYNSVVVGHIANSLKPRAAVSRASMISRFQSETGCKLHIQQEIDIT